MNNVIKFSYIYFPISTDILLINVIGKLIFKFVFYSKYKFLPNKHKEPNVEFHFVNQLTENFIETILENESLQFYASKNWIYEFQSVYKIDDRNSPMKPTWNVLRSFFFDKNKTVKGISVENDIFIKRNQIIKVDRLTKIISNSVVLISNNLVNKFFKLLICPEIIDLLVEKSFLNKLNSKETEKSIEFNNDMKTEKYVEIQEDSIEKTESVTSFTIISSGRVTINDKILQFNLSNSTKTETPVLKNSKFNCEAAGDINRLQTTSNFDDDKITEISRISKARNWILNNQKQTEMICKSSTNRKSNSKKSSKTKKQKSKQNKNNEKSKLPRFIVKKSDMLVKNSTNNSSTNLSVRKKPPKLRFTVLKSKSISQEIPSEIIKIKPIVKYNGNLKKNSNILTSIRQDVLNLANELHNNYIKNSKSILNPTKNLENFSNKQDFENRNKKDILLDEVRKRLQLRPIFKKIKEKSQQNNKKFGLELINLDTVNCTKSITSKKLDSYSCQYDATLSLITSSNNPFNSSFLTASDNTVTSYKSIASSVENASPCLNTLDLRDIHLISDEIHQLAQKELMKSS